MPSNWIDLSSASRRQDLGKTLGEGQYLPLEDGHAVWWCEGGDPQGFPVLIVHGGPGGRSRAPSVEWWKDLPVRWICIDQRGCGRSTPLGSVQDNTVAHLVSDMERLRQHLGLRRWGMAAGSWGAYVALAYARVHWPRLAALFLRSPFLGSAQEVAYYLAPWSTWLGDEGRAWLNGAGDLPPVYQVLANASRDGTAFSLGATECADGSTRTGAVAGYFEKEQSVPGGVKASGSRFVAAHVPAMDLAALAGWQIHHHYAQAAWTVGSDAWGWAKEVCQQRSLPTALVHGADDALCPVSTSRQLAAWQADVLYHEVAGGGHQMTQDCMRDALVSMAADWVARIA